MEKNGYRLISSLLLSVIGLHALGSLLGVQEPGTAHVVVIALAVCLPTVWCQVRIKGRVILCMSLTATLLVTWFVLGAKDTENLLLTYQEYVKVFALGMVCFFLQLILEKLFALKILVSVGLLAMLFFDLFTVRELAQIAVISTLTYVVITYVEWVQLGWKKERTNRKKQYVMWVMPFLALYFGLMCMMPVEEKPYDWQFAKDAYESLRETFRVVSENWFNTDREDFKVGSSGFSGKGGLLGGLSENDEEIMRIKGQKNLKTNVYLIGKVYDTFEGKRWVQESKSDKDDRTLDALETLHAVRLYEEESQENYVQVTKLAVTYRFFHTGYLFSPLKTVGVSGVDKEYTMEGGNRILPSKKGYGTSYTATFVQINVDHPMFYEFLDRVEGEDAEVFRQVQRDYRSQTDARYTLKDLEDYRAEIKEIYGVKCEVSDEVKAFLQEATKDADSDIEKLKAIEAALSRMEYTLNPGELPDEIDTEAEFLDYFLLENKKGYCSYYATAFVLLARAEGIPARYVEGFCVPVEGDAETIVYSSMAHAWPEVYMEGAGWVPFEPTPGYEEIRYTPWEMEGVEVGGTGDGTANGVLVEQDDDWEEEFEDGNGADLTAPEDEAQEDEEGAVDQGHRNMVKILLFTLLFVTLVCLVVVWLDGKLKKRRYEKLSERDKFLWELRKNMKMLAFLGYERKENETLTELQERAWAIMEQDEELKFLRYYEDVVYGEHAATEEMLQVVIAEGELLLSLLKKWKKLVYYYCKWILRM